MIQRADIVVLQYPRCVEVIDEATRALSPLVQSPIVEVLDYTLNLIQEAGALLPGVVDLAEAGPEGEHDDLRLGPAGVYLVDELDVAVVELRAGDIVDGVVVVGAEIDDRDVGCRMGSEVPIGNACWVYVRSASDSWRYMRKAH